MVDRMAFISSIAGVVYPDMLVRFYDHFIALKNIVEDTATKITVDSTTDTSISFYVYFRGKRNKQKAFEIARLNSIVIYSRPMHVSIQDISENEMKLIIQ